jgi:2-polyprenyl-6-methoxyphenol hydroxylase-like FAD-dependent oxidoreductase
MDSGLITVVGGGQAGVVLALALQQDGLDVRLVQDRSPDTIRSGHVMSSQAMFQEALEIEKRFGLNLWDDLVPRMVRAHCIIAGEPYGEKAIEWTAGLDYPAQSIDQRLKLSVLIDAFADRGGNLEIQSVEITDLERYANDSALVIVAAGRGGVSGLFERDVSRSRFSTPQRSVALTYLKGVEEFPAGTLTFMVMPGIGECFGFQALSLNGPCFILTFEGIIGGPMDSWDGVASPSEHFRHSLAIIEEFFPWQRERFKYAELTDDKGTLSGHVTPVVRKPVGVLPSGKLVLGMGDSLVLNDPIAGQGANNAVKCADTYHRRIVGRIGHAFDRAWMEATFEEYWARAKAATDLSTMLLVPPPHGLIDLHERAQHEPETARRLANGFAQPADLVALLS